MFQILYSVYFAAYSVGDIPKYFLNAVEKWLLLANPTIYETCVMLILRSLINRAASVETDVSQELASRNTGHFLQLTDAAGYGLRPPHHTSSLH